MRLLLTLLLTLGLPIQASPNDLPSPVERWLEANNTPNEHTRNAIIDEVVSIDFTSSSMDDCRTGNRQSLKQFLSGAHQSFTDYRLRVKDSAIIGKKVWLRLEATGKHTGPLLGHAPSGNEIAVGLVVILRIENNHVIQEWQLSDLSSLSRQLAKNSNLAGSH